MIEHRKVARIGEDARKKVVFEGVPRAGLAPSSQPADGLTLEQADTLYPRKETVYTKVEIGTLLLEKADVGHGHSMVDLWDRISAYSEPNYDVGSARFLRWSRYGVNHEIIDASSSQAPNLAGINQVDPGTAWLPDMPVLMGWNGVSTYGVRVDRSRYADSVEYGGIVRISTGGAATMASLQASNLAEIPGSPGTTGPKPIYADGTGNIVSCLPVDLWTGFRILTMNAGQIWWPTDTGDFGSVGDLLCGGPGEIWNLSTVKDSRAWLVDGAVGFTPAANPVDPLRMRYDPAGGVTLNSREGSQSPFFQAYSFRVGGNKVVGARVQGWGAPTGTPTRTTFATGSVTLEQLAERVKALIDDLTNHGLIGA